MLKIRRVSVQGLNVVDAQRTVEAFGVGAWGAVLSTMAALVAVVFQNILAYLKTKADIEHQRALDDLERQRLLDRLEILEREQGAD